MGKGSRNRLRRKEATSVAIAYGHPGRATAMTRYLRRQLLQRKRQKHPSTPKGPTVWRPPNAAMGMDSDGGGSVHTSRTRDRLLRRKMDSEEQ